ncbi:MAG: aldehyde dehydrogenase family protein, partial [Pseudomonadota bacterium]
MIQSINPYNNKLIHSYELLNADEIKTKIIAADQSFQQWKLKTVSERLSLISKLAEVLLARKN